LENARLYGELRAYVRQVEDSQRALTQAEKMAAVGRLTASIAHEVNNPLQAVLNCLHLAEREELTIKEREDYMQMARDELERLRLTVQRMLDFYRPGALERKPADIVEILDRVLKLLEQQLGQNEIRVHNNFANNVPAVTVVSNQIQQVFFNIILNAMESMPIGGDLTIEGGRKKNMIEIMFQDTGKGVPPNQHQEIFEPFMSTREDGSGLGLSVSYGILTAHGGNLEFVPGKGEGACFRVSIPIEEKK
jgi:two-component system NtrC family sensor kinase